MNIVLIVIDTLRYDYIGALGNDWIQTPSLDKLAARSWRFHQHQCASYPTIPHRTDVLTGKYGGPFHPWRPLRHSEQTFPELLGQAGYCAQLIHDTPHLVNGGHNFDWPFHAWDFVRGAEVDRPWITDDHPYPDNWDRDPIFAPATWALLDDDRVTITYSRANGQREKLSDWHTGQLFNGAKQWVRDNETRSNAFLWIDCFDPHEPWDAPPEYMQLYDKTPGYGGSIDPLSFIVRNEPWLSDAARQRIAAAYAAKVTWVDNWLGEFLKTLYGSEMGPNTAVILTADHGTNVGELGRFGKGVPPREPEAHTPLLVALPGDPGGDCYLLTQPQDICATVLALAGLPLPEDIQGYDVIAQAKGSMAPARKIALAGRSLDLVHKDPEGVVCTVMDGTWYLEMALRPEQSHLRQTGDMRDQINEQPELAAQLRSSGLQELAARGADPRLMAWLQAEGAQDFPSEAVFWDGWPGPEGFYPYYERLYARWM